MYVVTRPLFSRLAVGCVALMLAAVACSDSGGDVILSDAGARGKRISAASACASCHGSDGQGGIGPAWVGLAGSEVVLRGGETTIADDAYLIRAIADPGADLLEDYQLQMPRNRLDESEIADIVAYIKDLSQPTDD